MKAIAASCIIVCGVSLSAHADNFERTVTSGQTALMHDYRSWGPAPQCASNAGIVKVQTKPLHGKLTTCIVNSVIERDRIRGVTQCSGKPIKAFQVNYTSARGFRGTDSFTLDVTFGSGRRHTDVYTVTVK